jgi:uncharacterized protein with PIN domain
VFAATPSANTLYLAPRDTAGQLRALLVALGLRVQRTRLFSRCSRCNHPLEPVAKESLAGQVPPQALARYDAFARCPACDQIYWQGGHYDRIFSAIDDLLD